MTSRRNFVIGAGTLLTGSGTFLGSGAFEVPAGQDSRDWIPVSTGTTPSEEMASSLGIQNEGQNTTPAAGRGDGQGGGEGGDGGTDTPGGDGGGTDDDSGADSVPEPDEDRGDDDGGDDRGGRDDPGDANDRPAGEPSVRLEATGSGILDSPHVLTNGDGTLRGLSLQHMNTNALTYVGETSDGRYPRPGAGDQVAFRVVNDGDVAVDLRADVRGTAPGVLNFPSWVDPAVRGPSQRDLASVAVEGLQPGQAVSVVIEVDTTEVGEVPPDAVEEVTFVADPVGS